MASGWALMVFGFIGVARESTFTHPRSLAVWVLGGLVVHDLLVAPLVFVFARGLRRLTRGLTRAVLQAAAFASAMLALVSVPVIERFTRSANPTLLPRNYAAGLAVALGVVWVFALVALAAMSLRQRR